MEHTPSGHGLISYLAGFGLALVLSAIPFALVAMNALPKPHRLIVIGVAAILIFIMVGGSFWIMFDLHQRMLV